MYIFLLRHAPTPWNAEGRIQGRTDIELSPSARAALDALQLPARWLQLDWYTSPLKRTQQTAQLLGAVQHAICEELTEMHWGDFEGLTLAEINQQIAQRSLTPDRGLDLLPPGGESPRMVQQRLQGWLSTISSNNTQSMIAVTHKGVIRAALGLATGWDMMDKFQQRIDWGLPQCFNLSDAGDLSVERLNCPWENTSLLH